MSAEHNHPPRCCCPVLRGEAMPTGRERPGEHWNARLIREEAEGRAATACPGCFEHGELATPYTEQETTNA